MVYLDHAATTPCHKVCLEAMLETYKKLPYNPSSTHKGGLLAKKAWDTSLSGIARSLSCNPENIIVTSGATEANNQAVSSMVMNGIKCGKTHFVVSAIEHPSILNAFNFYAKTADITVQQIYPNVKGEITCEAIREAINKNTGGVALMAVNNETGVVQPILSVLRLCKSKSVPLLVDATQAAFLYLQLSLNDIEYVTLSAHKFGGALGVGFLIANNPDNISPLLHGGGQQNNFRSGTHNLAALVGTASLIRAKTEKAEPNSVPRIMGLLYELLGTVSGMHFNNPKHSLPIPILSVRFDGVENTSLQMLLSEKYDVYVSAGSACHSQSRKASPVLLAQGLTEKQALSTIRISPSQSTTIEDIYNSVEAIKEAVNFLRH